MESDTRMIEHVTRIGYLYDLYGALLTARQREMMEMYYLDDWSLAEIAAHLDVSRQAVHDNIRRAVDQLKGYENALGLLELAQKQRDHYAHLVAAWNAVRDYVPQEEQMPLSNALKAVLETMGQMRIVDCE